MVWVGISANGKTDLVIVLSNLNSRRYTDEILRPHVVQYRRRMGWNSNFQDNNARPHRDRIVDYFLRKNRVARIEWPCMSPDLDCIEHP